MFQAPLKQLLTIGELIQSIQSQISKFLMADKGRVQMILGNSEILILKVNLFWQKFNSVNYLILIGC